DWSSDVCSSDLREPIGSRFRYCQAASVHIVLGVVHVELAGRGDQPRVADDALEFQGPVVHHHDGRFLLLTTPHREPHLVPGPVVFGLDYPARALGDTGPLGNRQYLVTRLQIVDVEYRHRLGDLRGRVEGGIHVEVAGFGVGLDEQRATALPLQGGHYLPRMLGMVHRIGPDQRDGVVTQVAGAPHRPELRVHEVGATARVRDLADIHNGRQLAVAGVDHHHRVGVVVRRHEVAVRAVPAAVMQELGGADTGHAEVLQILVVDQHDLTGFLDVDDELRMLVGGDNGRHPRFGVILLLVHGHAPCGDDLQRLQGLAVHDHELRRPVVAGNHIPVLEALELGGFHRARLDTHLDFRDLDRLLAPQVDHVDLGIATDDQQVAAGGGHPRDVHRIAGIYGLDDLLAVAIDQGDLAIVTQGHREQVGQVQVVHLPGRPVLRLDQHVPGFAHGGHAPLRRSRRLMLDVVGHQGDLLGAQLPRRAPVRHAGG